MQNSDPARFDFAAAIALVKSFKYTGLYSIEAGGGQAYDNVQKIYDALLPLI
jgi:hypothetical protein